VAPPSAREIGSVALRQRFEFLADGRLIGRASGAELRSLECRQLRVKDVDLERRQVVVRDG
jgi:hypothetical protein